MALTQALDELVTANRILAREGVVDSFGTSASAIPIGRIATCCRAPGRPNASSSTT